MVTIRWRKEVANFYKEISAPKVAQEIMSIGEDATPKQILDYARDTNTELHKCFEWNDSIAAGMYRLNQARHIARSLVIEREHEKPDEPQVRFFHKVESSEGYKPITVIIKREDEYQKLLSRAYDELRSIKAKYSQLAEIREFFELAPEI